MSTNSSKYEKSSSSVQMRREETPATRGTKVEIKMMQLPSPICKPALVGTPRIKAKNFQLNKMPTEIEIYHTPKNTPVKDIRTAKRMGSKAISMEELSTPTKRFKCNGNGGKVYGSEVLAEPERRAALIIYRFMLVSAWRRRRDEVRCLRRTLECQMSCSERLRLQTWTLKSLLDSDNKKLRLALQEHERLKQLVRDKELERLVLAKEKQALEQDVLTEQDRSSQLQIACKNSRNQLDNAHKTISDNEAALTRERDVVTSVRLQLQQARDEASAAEKEASRLAGAVERAEELIAALREESAAKEQLLEVALDRLQEEISQRARAETERAALTGRVSDNALETGILKLKVSELQAELVRLADELRTTRDQLACWPAPLTKLMSMARAWLRRPVSLSDAILWSVLPARHGC